MKETKPVFKCVQALRRFAVPTGPLPCLWLYVCSDKRVTTVSWGQQEPIKKDELNSTKSVERA
jgi:hypothetical protein